MGYGVMPAGGQPCQAVHRALSMGPGTQAHLSICYVAKGRAGLEPPAPAAGISGLTAHPVLAGGSQTARTHASVGWPQPGAGSRSFRPGSLALGCQRSGIFLSPDSPPGLRRNSFLTRVKNGQPSRGRNLCNEPAPGP